MNTSNKKAILSYKQDDKWIPALYQEDLPNVIDQGDYDKSQIVPALVHADFQQFITFHYTEAIDYITKLSMPVQALGFDNEEWSWSSVLAAYVYMYNIALPSEFIDSLLRSLPESGPNPAMNIEDLIRGRMHVDSIIENGDEALDAYVAMLYRRRDEIKRVRQLNEAESNNALDD